MLKTVAMIQRLRLLGVILIGFMGGCASRPSVLVTGYWPPTNEMLVPFSDDDALNPGGWEGENWKGLGYDVYAYFPTFPEGTDVNPCGEGDFQVDYQVTWDDFRRMSRELKPVAIISYGLGKGPWEIENHAVHLEVWHNDYRPPAQPGCFCGFSKTYQDGERVQLTLPVSAIKTAVNEAVPELKAWVDWDGDPGDFLCNYIALLAADYQIKHKRCRMAGFIHVGQEVDVDAAQKAHEVTLKIVINSLRNTSKP